ncbi:HNH endonuclease signature motif containing protein [Bacteroides sp.]|uniref:HNH endonuclease signature motif containing protein n=1 Tax=Bacteroides sp. TaxID=29523 RepID=UPI00261F5748|nr:HNH endonuclease signature motif containing protein [Bacteroides sp.]MDD3038860.1 HNH endonuclease signature motif containing protein [Bacteroides sp.]
MKTWTDEQLIILDSEYPTADLKELAGRLGKTLVAIKAKALVRKLKRSPDARVWSPDKRQKLIALYPDHSNLEIASMLGSTESAVAGMAFKLKLRKSAGFFFEHSSKGFFPKGHQPMNKGRKQTEYMSDAQIEKTKATRFKKGNIPGNHKPVGYERITKDKYIEVKTAEPNVFELKHRIVWIEHNGEIPPGYNIQFKDGDRQNVCIENLYMVSRSEQLKTENSMYARYPEEVQYLIKLKGALNRQINKATKNNESL